MPMSESMLSKLILDQIPDANIKIEDLRGDQNHYHAEIISSSFEGLSKIQQHQLVYKALGEHMGTTLHALKLTTKNKGNKNGK